MNRKLHGTLGMTLTWSVGWAALAFAVAALRALVHGAAGAPWTSALANAVLLVAPRWAAFGAAAGAAFALALSRGARWARSPWRAAAWGAGSGLVVPLTLTVRRLLAGRTVAPSADTVVLCVAAVAFGAAVAAGTVALARRDARIRAPGERASDLGPPAA
jgi:hypothetical protein